MEIFILFIDILEVVGAITIAYMVIMVHHRVKEEQGIDEKVFAVMQKERIVAFIGIACLITSLLLRIYAVTILT